MPQPSRRPSYLWFPEPLSRRCSQRRVCDTSYRQQSRLFSKVSLRRLWEKVLDSRDAGRYEEAPLWGRTGTIPRVLVSRRRESHAYIRSRRVLSFPGGSSHLAEPGYEVACSWSCASGENTCTNKSPSRLLWKKGSQNQARYSSTTPSLHISRLVMALECTSSFSIVSRVYDAHGQGNFRPVRSS